MKFTLRQMIVLLVLFVSPTAWAQPASPNVRPVDTSRKSGVSLAPPKESDAFTFLVFGDRTSGKPEGLEVLADAVRDANRLAPDFVMNVGDMVQGYNAAEEWLKQANEYKEIMNRLECPWYPTPGNHDVYWRGENRPDREHEIDYEANFGPLWYAFEYKNHWFVVLFSDEGDPATGEKNFRKPECQKMSDAQFDWLKSVLKKGASSRGVFVFLHQPRWLKEDFYGDDWNKVHAALVEAGNVKAVFAGHIHRLDYTVRDGIEYIVLATTGGKLSSDDPKKGLLHEIHHVVVRENGKPVIAALPVGTTIDVRRTFVQPKPAVDRPDVKQAPEKQVAPSKTP